MFAHLWTFAHLWVLHIYRLSKKDGNFLGLFFSIAVSTIVCCVPGIAVSTIVCCVPSIAVSTIVCCVQECMTREVYV